MGDGSGALWFGAAGFEVLDVVVSGSELVVEVQTTAAVIGCGPCGARAGAKGSAPTSNGASAENSRA